MNIAIRYYTRSGNTKKLADAIGEELGIVAESVDVSVDETVDLLFLGSSVYAAGVDKKVKEFINSLDETKIKLVANFSTAALLPSTYSQVAKLLSKKGITLDKREFHCRGSFKFAHKGRPNDADVAAVKAFAKSFLEQ